MGSGLYGCMWTSLPTPFIRAQRLSEHTMCHDAQSTECEIPAHTLSKVSKDLLTPNHRTLDSGNCCLVCHHM